MATDTAFAVALITLLGGRVPVELRIFLTAAAIVDDIGAILVVALFYSNALDFAALGAGVVVVGVLAWLNNASVYRLTLYSCSASCSGFLCTPVGCTRRSRVWCSRPSFPRGRHPITTG